MGGGGKGREGKKGERKILVMESVTLSSGRQLWLIHCLYISIQAMTHETALLHFRMLCNFLLKAVLNVPGGECW